VSETLGETRFGRLSLGVCFLSDMKEEMPQEVVLGKSVFIRNTDEGSSFVRFIALQRFAITDDLMENTSRFISFNWI
jgi:hypothetical protein